MGWATNIFPLLIVVSGPPFTGLFIYSPGPGAGNLIASITAQAGTDPYGNHYAAGISSYDGFGGQTELFGALIQLSSGLNILQKINPQGYVTYSPNAAAGNLVASIAPAAFTDAYGNSVLAGFVTYTQSAPFIASQVFNGQIQFWQAASQAGPWTASGPLILDGSLLSLASGSQTAVQASLQLSGGATQAATLAAFSGPVALPNEAIPSNALTLNASILFASGGHLKTVSTATGGDGGTYGTERVIQEINGTLPQVISSTSQVNVQGLSVPVAAGKYRIRGRLSCTMGGSAGPMGRLVITGPAITQMEVGYWSAQNNPGAATLFTATQTAIGTLTVLTSVNQGAGSGFTVLFDGTVTFSAAGTMTLAAAESLITSVSWQINANSYWEIAPE